MALIFQLEYRLNTGKDMVIGWCVYMPADKEEDLQVDMVLGPGVTVLGEVLWDQSVVRKHRKL